MKNATATRATRPSRESATTTNTRQLFQALAIGGVGPVALGIWPGAAEAAIRRR